MVFTFNLFISSRLNRRQKHQKLGPGEDHAVLPKDGIDCGDDNECTSEKNCYERVNKDKDPQFKRNKNKKNRHHNSKNQAISRKPTLLQKVGEASLQQK